MDKIERRFDKFCSAYVETKRRADEVNSQICQLQQSCHKPWWRRIHNNWKLSNLKEDKIFQEDQLRTIRYELNCIGPIQSYSYQVEEIKYKLGKPSLTVKYSTRYDGVDIPLSLETSDGIYGFCDQVTQPRLSIQAGEIVLHLPVDPTAPAIKFVRQPASYATGEDTVYYARIKAASSRIPILIPR